MDQAEKAKRHLELLSKRWRGEATSEEQDECDRLGAEIEALAEAWAARHRELAVDVVKQ